MGGGKSGNGVWCLPIWCVLTLVWREISLCVLRKLGEIKILRIQPALYLTYLASYLPFNLDLRCKSNSISCNYSSLGQCHVGAGFRTRPDQQANQDQVSTFLNVNILSLSLRSIIISLQSFYYKEEEFWCRKLNSNICFQAVYFNSLQLLPYLGWNSTM